LLRGLLFVVNLVGAGNTGQLGIRLELVDIPPFSGMSAAVACGAGFSFDRCREWCRPCQDFYVAEDTGQAICCADSTGDLAAADGNNSRRWS
jgi:hypothetical protein